MRELYLIIAAACALTAREIEVKESRGAFPLDGVWKQQAGDDPRWADPAFDDSSWSDFATPRQSAPGPRGYSWYRVTLRMPGAGEPLWILVGPMFPAYEIFADGKSIGRFGEPDSALFGQRYAQPAIFPLPRPSDARQQLQIAIRVFDRNLPFGFQASPASLSGSWAGPKNSLEDRATAWKLERLRRTQPMRLISWTLLLGALFFLAMPIWRRNSPENMWFGLFLLMVVFVRTLQFVPDAAGLEDRAAVYLLYNASALPVIVAFWPRFMASLFRARHSVWSWTGISITLILMLLAITGVPLALWPAMEAGVVLAAWFVLNINQAIVYIDVSRHMQAGEKGMWPVHAAIILYLATSLIFYSAPFFSSGRMLGMGSDTPPAADVVLRAPVLLFMFAMMILLNRRAAHIEAEQGRLSQELAAAAEIQALILPSSRISGVESVYLAASEVGGDFYQVLELDDGSKFLAVGDVSGKGLKAAMLVSVAIGALRSAKEHSPATVLAELNRVLVGHTGGGFVTCCCLRVDAATGAIAIANAGHLAPYRNGEEIAMESGMPLGLTPGVEYAEVRLRPLAEHEQITILSDGVIEAAKANGELFGFDRTREISTKSAAEIAEAARAWGQNDDITVVTVRRSV